MKKKKIKPRTTYLRAYKSDVALVIGSVEDTLVWAKGAMMKEKFPIVKEHLENNPPPDSCVGRTIDTLGGGSVIWMREWNAGTFVHELVHATGNLFEAKGIPLNRDTEEVFAYVMQDLYDHLRP